MSRIFISYRRADSEAITGRIYDHLAQAFGPDNVFQDVDDIPPGVDFRTYLQNEVGSCDVEIVVIGRIWATITDNSGKLRLEDENDFVRIEVEAGLNRKNILVIPVLVNDATMPAPNDLPSVLRELLYRNAVKVRNNPDFNRDMDRLTDQLRRHFEALSALNPSQKSPAGRSWKFFTVVAITILLLGLLTSFLINSSSHSLSSFNPQTAAANLLTSTIHAVQTANAPDLTGTVDAIVAAILITEAANRTATADLFTDSATVAFTPSYTSTSTETSEGTDTSIASLTPTINTTSTAFALATVNAQFATETQNALDIASTNNALATQNAPTNTPHPTATSTQTSTQTLTLVPTITPAPTLTTTKPIIPTDVPTAIPPPTANSGATLAYQSTAAAIGTQAVKDANATLNAQVKPTMRPIAFIEASEPVNLRNGPGTQFAVLSQLTPNTKVYVMGYAINSGTSWVVVQLEDGKEGYIVSNLLDIVGTPTPTPDPFNFGITSENTVKSNSQWIPKVKSFDNFEMILVPTGCFLMGVSPDEGNYLAELYGTDAPPDWFTDDPAHEICIENPFWLDKYEVTNSKYGFSGPFAGSDMPVTSISWAEARDFCTNRGGYLPSEAQWEYAARGPDNLIYPWGNLMIADNVVYEGNSEDLIPQPVGSKIGGVSWVGALDLSGNVWEWTNSLYGEYPFNAEDGRENNQDLPNSQRVARGGSFQDRGYLVFSASRFPQYNFDGGYWLIGFRCARDFVPTDLN